MIVLLMRVQPYDKFGKNYFVKKFQKSLSIL